MSDANLMMVLLAGSLAIGMWFTAYCARKTVEALQASTRVLQLLHDIMELQSKTMEDGQ